jgi:pyridoxal phosphate enzyme (YggS family)
MTDDAIAQNITKVRERIRVAAVKSHRDCHGDDCGDDRKNGHAITLMAVSKTRTADEIRCASNAGIEDVGENYLREALEKMPQLEDLPIRWHFIGPLQSNKTRAVAESFDWVHSVDRLKLARRLSDARANHSQPLKLCLQVNISGETSKSGVNPGDLAELAEQVSQLPNLQLRGLMAIPAPTPDPALQRASFARLRLALEQLQPQFPQMDCLSMGMSGDLESAIAEGATLVRIGTDIFGPRQ